ncbi:MAG: DNA cytosine methyltransferase [Legionellaceae bacterium]|nr:DNA cytosine methyltransferase [Legionellaceae bacterium]
MKIVSLFSGAGGLDAGLIEAGHEIIWANDFDKDCVDTYRANIGNHILSGDIENVDSRLIPESDIIVGGFPCQGFSLANLKRFDKDERNRLYLEFLRIVKDKKPKWFLAENVRGILSLANGEAIKKIETDFSLAGYRVQKKLLNTADFGVPQTRYRVIIVGTRSDLPNNLNYYYPKPTHSKKGEGNLKTWVSVGEALQQIPEPDSNHALPNHIFSQYKVTNRNFTGHRTTDPDKPSPTILARGNGKGGVCALQHPKNHRRMSVREQAIIQTFPANFEFHGSMSSCYRQVGNAVPVLFGKHLGITFRIFEQLSRERNENYITI